MAFWTTLALLCMASSLTAANNHRSARETNNICDTIANSTNKVQCFCIKPMDGEIRSADCYITSEHLAADDKSWDAFKFLKNAIKVTLTNSRGITLKYVPTRGLAHIENVLKLEIKYATIYKIKPYAFGNLTFLEELVLRDNEIKALDEYAFSQHRDLATINLDKNSINEINRNVFFDLPSLQKLFLTSNKITTIHDKAFQYLINLTELEINRNALFSLNSDTFAGLKHLQRLDLSSNSLEVIGDNTFLPLKNLRSLNLEGNKIQMLDEKAFNGLWRLQSLSLARNKLSNVENVKLFEGLESLSLLSFKDNQLRELRTEVMAPILSNFYRPTSYIEIEGNSFPCQCNLDWFLSLMNKTQNNRLKLAIENLQCYPESEIRELYMKSEDTDKASSQVLDDEEPQATNTEYEYYDETQLNGKLFYVDMRYLLNCSNPSRPLIPQIKVTTKSPITQPQQKESENEIIANENNKTTKDTIHESLKPQYTIATVNLDSTNHGLLDLSNEEATTKAIETLNNDTGTPSATDKISSRPYPHTTTRLATVSAKPLEQIQTFNEMEMAADEAKPDQLRASRAMQEEVKKMVNYENNNAQKNLSCVILQLAAIILVSRFSF